MGGNALAHEHVHQHVGHGAGRGGGGIGGLALIAQQEERASRFLFVYLGWDG